MLRITASFNQAAFRKQAAEHTARVRAALLSTLQRVGEAFINEARENGAYQDQTGNLRNSIGYVILHNGLQLVENFTRAARVANGNGPAGGDEGMNKSRAMIERLIAQGDVPSNGYVLLCVAGMDYAAAVEAQGRDVISGSSAMAAEMLKQAVSRLSSKL